MLTRRSKHALARELTDGLMDYRAVLMERERADAARLQRLAGMAQTLEAALRADGNPERVAGALHLDAGTSDAAD